jgi:two-component SAPR family response regulator
MEKLIVVENEPLIALLLEDLAREIGWQVLGWAASESEALALLRATTPTAAILDINLGSTSSFAVADACRDRAVAVVFVTGYDAENVRDLCRNAPILSKPFTQERLRRTLEHLEQKPAPVHEARAG